MAKYQKIDEYSQYCASLSLGSVCPEALQRVLAITSRWGGWGVRTTRPFLEDVESSQVF